jgi:hypothetical protein
MDLDITETEGACHCGTVRFRVRLTNGLHTARRCTCSYCRMRGAVMVTADLDGIEMIQVKESLGLYEFGTRTAKHFFCSKCGIYTHHQRRSNPRQIGLNVACLKDVGPFDFEAVPVNDGVRHPTDSSSGGPRIDGILRYERFPVQE